MEVCREEKIQLENMEAVLEWVLFYIYDKADCFTKVEPELLLKFFEAEDLRIAMKSKDDD